MTTVLDLIDKGTGYLEKRGIEDARRNMQLLVAERLGCTRMDLYLRFDEPVPDAELEPLREALKRRGEGVPLQHLLGSVGFRQLEFKCDARALIPRPETEELAELVAKRFPPPEGAAILDMGCGSGVLGLTLAHEFPTTRVTLVDLSAEALELARENAAAIGAPTATGPLQFVESDLFAALPADAHFDLIVANLPYVAERERDELAPEVRHDPPLALFGGEDGLEVLRRFLPEAARRMNAGGRIALEIGHDQHQPIESLMHELGLRAITTHADLNSIPRFVVARAPATSND